MSNSRFGPLSSFSQSNQGYLVAFNDVEPKLLDSEHDLGAGWHLRRTTITELEKLRVKHHFHDWLQYTYGYASLMPHSRLYENGKYDATKMLPQDEWRITLVYADDTVGIGPDSLTQALAISDLQLMIGASSSGGENPPNCGRWRRFAGYGVRSRPTGVTTSGIANSAIPFPNWIMSTNDLSHPNQLENARNVIEWRRAEAPPHVLNAIKRFLDLDRLPDYSEFKHLGYFAILESILSHAPQDGDRVDSISRQLRRNLSLVNHRLTEVGLSIPFDPFGNAGLDKIVSRLYSFRSAVAHGGDLQGALESINKLRVGNTTTDMCWMHDYLRSIVRRVIQALIREPELFLHIK